MNKLFTSFQRRLESSDGKQKFWMPAFAGMTMLLVILLMPIAANATTVQEVSSRGVKGWMIEDNSLPVIAVKIAFKNAGYAHDLPGKQGLSYFVSSTLNEGAGQYDSQTFQKLLDENAIQIGFGSDADNFFITLKTISANLPLAVELLRAALTEPHFSTADVERVRSQILTVIKKSDEDAGYIAAKRFTEVMYKNHPYSNLEKGTVTSISNITSEDLINYVASNFARSNAVVGIVGDVDDSTAEDIIRQLVDRLPEEPKNATILKEPTLAQNVSESLVINNPQTTILFGQKGVKRSDPDFFAAYVLNHILGGDGFQSRLVKSVREERGLAYYIGTNLSNMNKSDLWLGSVGTTAGQTNQVIDLIKKNFDDVAKNGVTKNELKAAKSFLTGSFALNLDKNEKLAAYMVMMQLEDLGIDYLDKRNSYINSVTLEHVNNLAKALFSSQNLVFVTAGKKL